MHLVCKLGGSRETGAEKSTEGGRGAEKWKETTHAQCLSLPSGAGKSRALGAGKMQEVTDLAKKGSFRIVQTCQTARATRPRRRAGNNRRSEGAMDDPNQLDLFLRTPAPAPASDGAVKTHSTAKLRGKSFLGRLTRLFRVKNAMPCVGLVVLAGCLTFIVAPDEETTEESRLAAALGSLPTVVIDPGHGGKDNGALSHGLKEKELSLDLALRLEKTLKTFGLPTVLTRRDDTYLSLAERAAVANKIENAIFVSLHFNHSRNSAATGVETFYATEKVAPESAWAWVGMFTKPEGEPAADNGEDLAGYIQAALVSHTDAANRGIKQRPLYVVRHTRCPAVLVEGGFLNNPLDARLLANGAYLDRLAKAIAEGVLTFQKNRPRTAPAPPKIAAH